MQIAWFWPTTAALATLTGFFGWQWYQVSNELAALRALAVPEPTVMADLPAPAPVEDRPVKAPNGVPPAVGNSAIPPPVQAAPPPTLRQSARRAPRVLGDAEIATAVEAMLVFDPDLPEALGLSQDDARTFLKMFMGDAGRAMAELHDAVPSPTSEQSEAMVRDRQQAVAAQFGQQVVEKFFTYQKAEGARHQVNNIHANLAVHDVPLSRTQRRQLTDAIVKLEASRRNQDGPGSAQQPVLDMAAAVERARRSQDEFNRELLAAATPILSPQQLNGLARYFEAMQRVGALARIESGIP